MKSIFYLLFLFLSASVNSYAIDIVFDKKQNVAKILEINEIQETYTECTDEYMDGKITKVEGSYPIISIHIESKNQKLTSGANIYLEEMDMVTVKAINTIIFPGSRVKTYIQRCGSGAIPYLIYIKSQHRK